MMNRFNVFVNNKISINKKISLVDSLNNYNVYFSRNEGSSLATLLASNIPYVVIQKDILGIGVNKMHETDIGLVSKYNFIDTRLSSEEEYNDLLQRLIKECCSEEQYILYTKYVAIKAMTE